MKIDKNLKELIDSRGITVAILSRSTDIPRQTLDNWLYGQEPRSLLQLKKVANFASLI